MKFTVELPKLYDEVFDIVDYGATSGGVVSNSIAIQSAINDASLHGGKVIIPKGIFLSGPIELKSNVNLHIEAGGVLLFDKNKEEYPLYLADFEGLKMIRTRSPIYAFDAVHIAITGDGVINGNGHKWRPLKRWKVTELEWKERLKISDYVYNGKEEIWFPTKSSYEGFLAEQGMRNTITNVEEAEDYYDYYRPVMIHLSNCKHVLIDNITLMNSPAWNLHPIFCEHITIRHTKIRNPHYAQNGDGLDLESCKYAHIHNCIFDVGDDAICIKSGKGAEAREILYPTEHVLIEECVVYHGHGGFVIGSEMSRGVRDIWVSNCTFIGTDIGIRFKSALGRGGIVKDIHIKNIQMLDITKEAIIFMMSYALDYEDTRGVTFKEEDTPYFKDIYLDNILCNGAELGLKIEGIDPNILEKHGLYSSNMGKTIDNIYISNSTIHASIPFLMKEEGKIEFFNVTWRKS